MGVDKIEIPDKIKDSENQMNLLVSIIVITYNSSQYVLETLESAKAQTYQNIELIISDDCSTDNTVAVCQKWIEENNARFVRSEFLTVEKNTGITPNMNRGLMVSRGKWLKFIAGDDILMNSCIQQNINYIYKNTIANFVFSRVTCFGATKSENELISRYFNYEFFSLNVNNQFKYLIHNSNCVPAPSGFIKRDTLIKIGKFDERIKFLEDYPLWIKATKQLEKLYFFDDITVKYRIHENSISQVNLSKTYYHSTYLVFTYYILPHLMKINPFDVYDRLLVFKSKTTSSKITSNFFVFLRITSPYAYYKFFIKFLFGR